MRQPSPMKPCTAPKGLSPSQARTRIIELLIPLLPAEVSKNLSDARLEFYIDKFIADVLDYCHIQHFPEPLIYSAVDLIKKRIGDEAAAYSESAESTAPVKKIKQDDTEFEFAVNAVDLSGCLADLDFDALKPKLNLYRRLISW